jgi:hypothetical protein
MIMSRLLKMRERKPSADESKRYVTIDKTKNEEFEIYHVNDLSKSDRAEMWLTVQDIMETKRQYTTIVRMMMKSKEPLEETDECCCRGLGKFFVQRSLARRVIGTNHILHRCNPLLI